MKNYALLDYPLLESNAALDRRSARHEDVNE